MRILIVLILFAQGLNGQNIKSKIEIELPECLKVQSSFIDVSKMIVYFLDEDNNFQIDVFERKSDWVLKKGWFYVKIIFNSKDKEISGFEEFFKMSENKLRIVKSSDIKPNATNYRIVNEITSRDTIITYDPEDYGQHLKIFNFKKLVKEEK